jgi:hypothetical protein
MFTAVGKFSKINLASDVEMFSIGNETNENQMNAEHVAARKEEMTDRQKAAALDYLTGAMCALDGKVGWEQMANACEFGKRTYPKKDSQ